MSTQFAAPLPQQENARVLPDPIWPARYARFGRFQVDLQRQELYKDGQRARVQAKLFQALLVLLNRPGDIVAREEVCRCLWPDALVLNWDANVNTTMNKLRLVLGDSSMKPTYIETIPRRGYSWIAAVEFSNLLLPASAYPAAARGQAKHPEAFGSTSFFPWLHIGPSALRMISFVLIGMLMGTLLVLAWNFASSKSQRSKNVSPESASASASPNHQP